MRNTLLHSEKFISATIRTYISSFSNPSTHFASIFLYISYQKIHYIKAYILSRAHTPDIWHEKEKTPKLLRVTVNKLLEPKTLRAPSSRYNQISLALFSLTYLHVHVHKSPPRETIFRSAWLIDRGAIARKKSLEATWSESPRTHCVRTYMRIAGLIFVGYTCSDRALARVF